MKKSIYLVLFLFICLQVDFTAASNEHGYIVIHTTNEKNYPINGVQFKLYDANGALVDQAFSDKDGYVLFTNLEYKKYTVKQEVTPTLYKNNLNQWDFNLSRNNKYKFINNPLKISESGSISIWNFNSTREGVPGFSYGIYDKEGDLQQKITTDESGEAQSSRLDYGTYYIKQIDTPDEYEVDDKTYQLEISNQYSEVTLIKENTYNSSNITFKILDTEGSSVPNITYDLYNGDIFINSSTTNKNGVITFDNISPGNYVLVPSSESKLESIHVNVENSGVVNGNPGEIYLSNDDSYYESEDQATIDTSTEKKNHQRQ